nr:hypothetical protein [uncultured bacterium]
MLENRRDRRNKKNNKVPAVKNSITKKDKIIWIGILIVVILLICFVLFLQFLKYFISV